MVYLPGEKLIIKLTEVFQQGVGVLGRPWQIRREGRAHIDVLEEKKLRLAQVENEIEEIRQGRKQLVEGRLVALPPPPDRGESEIVSTDPDQDVQALLSASKFEADYLAARRSINLRRIELLAHQYAEGTADEEVTDEPMDPDWFARWREAAQDVSNEEMRQLWARLITGEVKSPGTFSLQTVSLLRNLSQQQAGWIATLGSFSFGTWMFRDCVDLLAKKGITLDVILELEGLSVLGGIEAVGGLVQKISLENIDGTEATAAIMRGGNGLIIKQDLPAKELHIPMYKIMKAAQELISLGSFQLDREYLLEIAKFARQKGYRTSLGVFSSVPNQPDLLKIISESPITDPEEDAAKEAGDAGPAG